MPRNAFDDRDDRQSPASSGPNAFGDLSPDEIRQMLMRAQFMQGDI